jgi:PAS domain S-box-containing protein
MKANALANWLAQIPGDAAAVENGDGHLVLVNDALCQVLGYEPGELVGQPWAALLSGRGEGTDRPGAWSETRLRRKDGGTVPVMVTAWRLPIGSDGLEGRLSVFVVKGSPQDRAGPAPEAECAGENHRLASVAHEMNNALTIISFHSQLMSRIEAASPRLGEHLAILQDQVAHMKRIVTELRASPDMNGLRLEPTDVNAIIRYTLGIQELQLADMRVITDLVPDLPSIQADPHRLEQVFVNLINNACHVLAEIDPPRVLWVTTRLVSGENGRPATIRISFINNGPAIPSELLTRIFEPFFSTKAPGQGTGLGLTISARIVREHGGCIWVESQPGQGVAFFIDLPTGSAAAGHAPLSPSAVLASEAVPGGTSAKAHGAPHVLIVDGGPDEVDSVHRLLRQAGFDVALMPSATNQLRRYCPRDGDADEARDDLPASISCAHRDSA